MSTTAPSPETGSSTEATEPPSFDAGVTWSDGVTEVSTESSEHPAAIAERTTKQPFDPAEVLRRRYLRTWSHERRPRFILKQEWIGRVDEVSEDTFVATLVTRSAPEEVEQAEIEIDEVAPDDRTRLRRGAIFYWVVGYRDEPYGQRLGVSSIIFRTMIEPTGEELEHAELRAQRALAFLDSADPTSPERQS